MSKSQPALTVYADYIGAYCAKEDDALRLACEDSVSAGLPVMNVSATEGKLLQVLACSIGAKRILELGTLGGYSAIWMARAMPANGKLISLEISQRHADVARKNIARAGFSSQIEVRVGPALESLACIAAESKELFDLAFIDADKDGYPAYLDRVYPLVRRGGLILADNTLRPDAPPKSGIPLFNAAVAAHPGLTSIIIPVLRGDIDGLTVAVKTGD